MTNATNYKSSHAAKRDEIAAKTAEFLAKGNTIEQLPYGPDQHQCGELESSVSRKSAARKKGAASPQWRGKSALSGNSEKNRKSSGFKEQAA